MCARIGIKISGYIIVDTVLIAFNFQNSIFDFSKIEFEKMESL